MKNQTKLAISGAILAATLSSQANAGVSATSFIDMSNFLLKDAATDTVLDRTTDFNFIAFTSNADQTVSLGALSSTISNPSSTTGIDFSPICVGSGCTPIANNVFPVISGAPTGNYAAADQFEGGAPIAGLPLPTPASVANGAYVGIQSGEVGASADSNNGLSVTTSFSLAQSGAITLEFDVRAYLEAHVGAGELFPGSASAGYSFVFTLTDAGGAHGFGTIFEWEPNGATDTSILGGTEVADLVDLNASTSFNALGLPFDVTLTGGGHALGVATDTSVLGSKMEADTLALFSNNLYQLTARISTEADANRVPEPGTIGLMGLALLGLGASRKLKQNKQHA